MLEQAIILAGGKGTRLGIITKNIPKPMIKIGGVPFLEYLVWNLKRYNIKKILFLVGYKYQAISDHFHNGEQFGVKIDYVIENIPLGTGGAIKLAKEKLESQFLVLNGDTLFDINYHELFHIQCETRAVATIGLRRVADGSRYGSVSLNQNKIEKFSEKNDTNSGFISGGVYVLKNEIVDLLPDGNSSLEESMFPQLANGGKMSGKVFEGFFIDIGIPESLALASHIVPEWKIDR